MALYLVIALIDPFQFHDNDDKIMGCSPQKKKKKLLSRKATHNKLKSKVFFFFFVTYDPRPCMIKITNLNDQS